MEGNDLFLTIVVSCLTIFLVLSLVVALLVKSSIRQHEHRMALAQAELLKDQEILHAEQQATQDTLQEVGRELHDNVAQLLSLACLGLGSEMDRAPQNKMISVAYEGAVRALAEVRRLSHTLNVDLWDELSINEAIANTISGAARRMQMSYRRAWLLVETMNSCFQHPLVVTATGGRAGGGAHLTPEGEKVLEGYTAMMREIDEIAERYLASLLGSSPLTPVPPESSSGSE